MPRLFPKKAPSFRIRYKMWLTESAKFRAMAREIASQPETAFLWPGHLFVVAGLDPRSIRGQRVIVLEHHLSRNKEIENYLQLNLTEPQLWSALDGPFFKDAGGERIKQLMKKMGMKEDESLELPIIAKAIGQIRQNQDKRQDDSSQSND